MRRIALLALCAVLASCSSDVGSRGITLRDPLDLIDDVQGPLRLFVLDAATHTCDPTTGMVTPEIPDVDEGMVDEAIVDQSLSVNASMASEEVDVPVGEFTVLVRGKGTDPVSGRMDVFIATACATASVDAGETQGVSLSLLPIVGMGVCGDGTFSPDEQCEDGNTTDGDGCSASCRVEPVTVNTTVMGVQNGPSVAGAAGRRWFVTYNSDNVSTFLRVLEADGSAVSMPLALMADSDVDTAIADVNGINFNGAVGMHSDGTAAWAFQQNPGPDVSVSFTDNGRLQQGATALVADDVGTEPAVAFAGNGAAMVVYEDSSSSTGISGNVFAAGSQTAGAAIEIGEGAGNAGPAVAGLASGFVVAYSSGGDVVVQRYGADGSAMGGVISAGDGAGAQDQATVAAMSDDTFVVAWRDEQIDGTASGIGYRAFGADGTPVGEAEALNTTTAGAQSEPAASANDDAYIIVWSSDGEIRGRVLSAGGSPRFNRELPPTAADFALGSGSEPAVAAGGDASFMAVWSNNDDIQGAVHPLP